MGHLIDLSGQHFGSWTVLRLGERIGSTSTRYWLCRCEWLRASWRRVDYDTTVPRQVARTGRVNQNVRATATMWRLKQIFGAQ